MKEGRTWADISQGLRWVVRLGTWLWFPFSPWCRWGISLSIGNIGSAQLPQFETSSVRELLSALPPCFSSSFTLLLIILAPSLPLHFHPLFKGGEEEGQGWELFVFCSRFFSFQPGRLGSKTGGSSGHWLKGNRRFCSETVTRTGPDYVFDIQNSSHAPTQVLRTRSTALKGTRQMFHLEEVLVPAGSEFRLNSGTSPSLFPIQKQSPRGMLWFYLVFLVCLSDPFILPALN